MAWISFAVVVFLFFTPFIGLGRTIQEQGILVEVNIESLSISAEIPYTGYVRLLLYSVASWLVLWALLLLLEKITKADVLSRARLRNGMLYALRPHVGNNIALVLAIVILVYPLMKIVLVQIDPMLGALLPYRLNLEVITLSLFTLIADRGFRLEQQYRYRAEIRRNQRERKRRQTAIEIPTAQK